MTYDIVIVLSAQCLPLMVNNQDQLLGFTGEKKGQEIPWLM